MKNLQNFCELDKKNAMSGTVKTLINDGKQITMPNEFKSDTTTYY